jgi:hypothetical protein
MAARGDNPLAADGENAMTVDTLPSRPCTYGLWVEVALCRAGGLRPAIVTGGGHHGRMDMNAIERHLDDVETYLRRAKRSCASGSEIERNIERALSALDDAQRLTR